MNTYIEVLKFGRDHQPTKYTDILDYLSKNNMSFNKDHTITHYDSLLQNAFRHNFQTLSGAQVDINSLDACYLKPEALAYLLNHEALELAKEDSKNARIEANKALKIATWSLWITALTAVIAIVVQILLDL